MTLELLHDIRDYILTRTSVPNHTSHSKDMKSVLITSIKKIQNHLLNQYKIQNQIGSSNTNNSMTV